MNPLAFGTLLRRYRRATALTQEELAERAGLSARTIGDLERGVSQAPHRDTIMLLAEALGLLEPERLQLSEAARRAGNPESSIRASLLTAAAPAFVGRAREMALLEQHLVGLGPPMLLIAGEPGIGKTRLLHAAVPRAVAQGWRVLEGGCHRRGGHEPYAPILGALQHHIRAQRAEDLRAQLRGCAWLARLLPELTGGPIEPLPDGALTGEHGHRLMVGAILRFLTNIAGPAGTMLLLDDLQWADSDALDLLAAIAHALSDTPLRMVCAYRNTDVRPLDALAVLQADLAHAGAVQHHILTPLSDSEATQLLLQLVEEPQRGTPAARAALQRTGGVPFYLVSYAQELTSRPEIAGDVPWTVAHSIRQRVAALPEPVQAMLQIASVVGRIAPRALLSAVLARSDFELLAALDAAGQAHLLVEDGAYAHQFVHDVIREVLEADLGAARRAVLHRLVAEALETQPGAPPVAELAYHYTRSDRLDKALPYLASAAEKSRVSAAHQEEAALLAQAIEVALQVGRTDLVGDLHARRGKALSHVTRWADARRAMQAALASLPPSREEQRSEILIDMALASHWLSDAASTRRYANEAQALAESVGREDLAIAALSALVFADSSDGKHQVGLNRFRHIALQAGDRFPAAVAPGMEMAAAMHYWLGDFDHAIQCAQQAIVLSRATYDSSTLARAQGDLGCALAGCGRYGEALQVFTEVQQESAAQGAVNWLARSTSMCAGLHLDLFDFGAALALADRARNLSRSANWMNGLASAGIDLLFCYVRTGEIGRAEELLGEVAEHVAQGQGTHGWLWKLRFVQVQAELDLARVDYEHALRTAEEALALSRKHGRVKYEVAALQVRAQALAMLGRQGEAIGYLRTAVRRARKTGDPAMFVRTASALLAIDGSDGLLTEARLRVAQILDALPEAEIKQRFRAAEQVQAIIGPANM